MNKFFKFLIWVLCSSCSVDDGFPTITFHFEDSLSLTVHPHEYLFDIAVSEMSLEQVVHVNDKNLSN